jgi:hypothetical protein
MLCAGPDMTHTMRLKIRKARALAAYRRANPGKPEFGPGGQTTPESVRAVRAFGQGPITVMTGGLQIVDIECCPAPADSLSPAPPG